MSKKLPLCFTYKVSYLIMTKQTSLRLFFFFFFFTAAQSLCYITEVSFIVHTMLITSYVTQLCSKWETRHSNVIREKNLEVKSTFLRVFQKLPESFCSFIWWYLYRCKSPKQGYLNPITHDTKQNYQSTVGIFTGRHRWVCVSDVSCSSSLAKDNIFLTFPHWNNRKNSSRGRSELQCRTKAGLQYRHLITVQCCSVPKTWSLCFSPVAHVQQGISTSSLLNLCPN